MTVMLVEQGVDYNIENKGKMTCLDIAEMNKHHKVEQYLISIGAKKGKGTRKVKKRSGRPASMHTQK